MKQLIAAVICALFALSTAYAQQPQGEAKKGAPAAEKKAEKAKKEPSEAQKKQQERMKDCNAKADGKSGDDRKKYMGSCLKGEDGKKEPSAAHAHFIGGSCVHRRSRKAGATGKQRNGRVPLPR